MTAFDDVFPDVARREYRVFAAQLRRNDPEVPIVFREIYCSRPRCDCRSVVILAVLQTDQRQAAAAIHYLFDPPKQRGVPQAVLDPTTSGPMADLLLDGFNAEVRDHGYRAKLLAHYAMWRSAVDDPSHPSHALVQSLIARETKRPPRRTPRKPAKKVAATTGVELEIAKRVRGADPKAQQRFSRLVRKVEGLRARVRAWHDERPAIERDLAIYQAEFATQRGLAKQLVERLDVILADPKLAKKNRAKLERLLCTVAKELIEDGHHDLKELHDRHARRAYDAEVSAEESAGVASLKAMMEAMGLDLDGADVKSFDDLSAVVEKQLADEEASASTRSATRKKTRKQVERETIVEAQKRDASKVLQDVYRKLAQALHPDLERDVAEQLRKTQLMQEVNAAYAKKDLLRLLELQLAFERVDENARDIAEERLVHYTRILDGQARELVLELDDLELPWRMQLDRPPPTPIAPRDVLAALRHDTDDLRRIIALQREDLVALADPHELKAWLRTVPDVRPQRSPF